MRSALAVLVATGVLAFAPAAHAVDFPELPGDAGTKACETFQGNSGLLTAFGEALVLGDSKAPPATEAKLQALLADACFGL